MNNIDITQVKTFVESYANSGFWWLLGIGAALFFKSTVENFVYCLSFLISRDYNVDDEVFIGGTKKARIVRQTITKTVFYVYENNTRLIVPNVELHSLRCEKVLPGTEKKD